MPTVEERLAVIEEQNLARMREDNLRRAEIDRRLQAIEDGNNSLSSAMAVVNVTLATLTQITKTHTTKATCVNAGAKVLWAGGAGGGVVTALVALVWALKQLGLI